MPLPGQNSKRKPCERNPMATEVSGGTPNLDDTSTNGNYTGENIKI